MIEEIDVWTETIVAAMTTMWSKIAGNLPNLLAAIIIMKIGYFAARFVGFVLSRVLKKIGFDAHSDKVGVTGTLSRAGIRLKSSEIVGALAFWIIIPTFLVTAMESLGLPRVSATIDEVVLYLPKVIAAAVIFVIGLFLASFLRDLVRSGAESLGVDYAKPLGSAAYAVLFVVIISLSINELEIENELLNRVIAILLGAIGVALALSLGLGTRDLSANPMAGHYACDLYASGASIEMENCVGIVDRVGVVKTTIKCDDASLMTVANASLLASAVRVRSKKKK